MQLILARHGNTFGLGDKVVWVGARNDFPLVEKGVIQAHAVAEGLISAGLLPTRIYSGPLQRTVHTARIIANVLDLGKNCIKIAEELVEIDYGTWEARSNSEIRAEVGDGPLDDWQKRSIWPEGFGWSPDESTVLERWSRLMKAIQRENADNAVVLIVSSNGIYRLVAKMLGLSASEAKMNTGAVSQLFVNREGAEVVRWNLDPAQLSKR